jgi:hypothetical protein
LIPTPKHMHQVMSMALFKRKTWVTWILPVCRWKWCILLRTHWSDSVSGNWTNESIGASSETWDVDSESIIDSITCSDSIEFDSVWQDWKKEAIVAFSTGWLFSREKREWHGYYQFVDGSGASF